MCKENEYVYYLPKEDGSKEEHKTNVNSVVIIGANGSGKSRLGAWMEWQDIHKVHRICGQRSLAYEKNLTLKNHDCAEALLLYSDEFANESGEQIVRLSKCGQDINESAVKESKDFEYALSTLFSIHNNRINKYYEKARISVKNGEKIDAPLETEIEKIEKIWNKIFPHRQLKYEDYNFWIKYNTERYNANQMSDGEREVLYLMAQVFSLPEKMSVIIDEPEIHLHPSIMYSLWLELEKARKDLLFIYITHDISFASMHINSDKIWVNEYFGSEKWNYQVLNNNDELPDKLLLEILGCRQNILFVEGISNSLDYRLYSILFPNLYIIPCGGCEEVIFRTKAVNRLNSVYNLYQYKAFGLIDRDYRSEDEISQFESDQVYCLKVAEVENLFITENVLKCIAKSMGKISKWESIFSDIKNMVIETKYKNNIKKQELNNIKYDFNKMVKNTSIDAKSEEEIQNEIDNLFGNIDFAQIKENIEEKYEKYNNKNYDEILSIYNEKGLSKNLGSFFGLDNEKFCDTVIDLLPSNDELKKSFYEYIPENIIKANTASNKA